MSISTQKPIIGINLENKPALRNCPEYSYISYDYVEAIVKSGGIPVLLPQIDDIDSIRETLSLLDGVVLTGGPDLDPRNDGFMLHPSVRPMTERREKYDRALMKEIATRRIPVLGIGAGMQLMNITLGGSLYLHIPEDIPSAFAHYDLKNEVPLRHKIIVGKGSLLYNVYGDNEVRVNSRHHMAIDDVANGFVISAYCPESQGAESKPYQKDLNFARSDVVVEAIESRFADWFALGVQFHPEATQSATDLDRQIFVEFLKGVIAYQETKRNCLVTRPNSKEMGKKGKKVKSESTISIEI